MASLPSTVPAQYPVAPRPYDVDDPRALNLLSGTIPEDAVPVRHEVAPVHILGVPFDGAVLGRKGCAGGPAAIREAFRFFTTYDMVEDIDLVALTVKDEGDVIVDADTRITHSRATDAVGGIIAQGGLPMVLGGDHSLTFAHIAGLAQAVEGRIGIIVVDAHYDLRRPKAGVVSSGTPFWRILHELPGPTGPRVQGRDIVEIGIRPFANSAHLARTAAELGVTVFTDFDLRTLGIDRITREALEILDGVDHLWLSIDMDGVDQSHAPGVSAPTPNGLLPFQLFQLARTVASDKRFAGLDILETAPNLDPTGNTARVAALTVLHAMAGHVVKS